MPKALHDRVNKIKAKNSDMPESEAYGIATKQLQKEGKMAKRSGGRKSGSKGPDDPKSVMGGKSSFGGLFGKKKK
jgi:hypothetical protein